MLTSSEIRICPFRGWATQTKAVVLGRTLGVRSFWAARLEREGHAESPLLRRAYERLGVVGVGQVPIAVRGGDQIVSSRSDARGLVDVTLHLTGDGDGRPRTAAIARSRDELHLAEVVELVSVNQQAPLGVISDIDDTVLETELTDPWKRMLQLTYSHRRMRLPFEGVSALYSALVGEGRPIFYVSNAPVHLYRHVEEILDHHEMPRGPLLLRAEGVLSRFATPGSGDGLGVHKRRALHRIVSDLPNMPFVLLGDSSRQDPLRYVELAERFPQRVAAIYIRRASGPLGGWGSLRSLEERARRARVEFVVADDTVQIARHARSRGFIGSGELARVEEQRHADHRAPPPGIGTVLSGIDEAKDPKERRGRMNA